MRTTMRTTRRHLLALAGAATATIAMPRIARAQKAIRMRLAHAANEVHPGHIATVRFKEALEKLLPGRVNIQIFSNRQLGDDKQSLESAIAGTDRARGRERHPVPARHRAPGARRLSASVSHPRLRPLHQTGHERNRAEDAGRSRAGGTGGVADHRHRPTEFSVSRKAGEDDQPISQA